MSADVQALAAEAAARLAGQVKRRVVREAIAAVATAAVNATITEVAERLDPDRVLRRIDGAGNGRWLPAWAKLELKRELAEIADFLAKARPPLCPRPADGVIPLAARSGLQPP